MNKRILQFAEQVGSTHKQNLGVYQFYTNELEKFAELIVKECARVSERTCGLIVDDFEGEMIAAAIKEHFGVEE